MYIRLTILIYIYIHIFVESSLSGDLYEEDEQPSSMDPFNPNERVFSKYAAMMYTSSDGKTYHEFKDAKYCPSCGEKVPLVFDILDLTISDCNSI